MKDRTGSVTSVEVLRRKRSLLTSLALLALVTVGTGAFALTGGVDLVSDILEGAASEGEIIAPLPPGGSATPAVETTPSASATSETSSAATAEPAPAEETSSAAGEPEVESPMAPGATTGPLATVYREQRASQAELERLVSGDIVSLTLGPVTPGSASARFAATISYRDGSSAPAVLGLRRSDDVWYVSSLGTGESPEGGAVAIDPSVTAAMVAAQSPSPDLLAALVAGTYFRLEFAGATPTAAGVSVAVRLTGARGAQAEGAVTCIADDAGAWFLTSIAQR